MEHNFALDLSYVLLAGLVVGSIFAAGVHFHAKKFIKVSDSISSAFIFAGILWQLMLYTGDGRLTNVTYEVFLIPFAIGLVFSLPSGFTKMFTWWRSRQPRSDASADFDQ